MPVSTTDEQFAAADVIELLKQTYPGITHSPTEPAIFTGFWLDRYDVLWFDAIAIAWTDLHGSTREYAEEQANAVRVAAEDIYEKAGATQQEIYVTCDVVEVLR